MSERGMLIFIIMLMICTYRISTSRNRKYKIVCRTEPVWPMTTKEERATTRRIVLSKFPYATIEEFGAPSERVVVRDERNRAISKRGYFVIGFDNHGINSSIPSGYDYYVKYSNDHIGSHFYLKARTLRRAIQGCQKQVRFIYKDSDTILKRNLLLFAFHPFRITYQREFHNHSLNAGFITGRATARTASILSAWDAGAGLAANLEQDQTILRALVARSDRDFFALPPNAAARHVYSIAPSRSFTLWKAEMLSAPFITIIRYLFLFPAICTCAITLRPGLLGRKARRLVTFANRLASSSRVVAISGALAYMDIALRNPMLIARALATQSIVDLGHYHSAYQLQADDVARIWRSQTGVYIGSVTETFRLPFFLQWPPIVLVQLFDLLYLTTQLVPFSCFFLFLLIRNARKPPLR